MGAWCMCMCVCGGGGGQGWAANSTPGIYHRHLPVFTGLENTPQVANTGKYWQIDFFFALNYSKNLK